MSIPALPCPHTARVRASGAEPAPARAVVRIESIEWHPAEELRDRSVRD